MLVGADEFVVHIHTLNLRPNRDAVRRSKALSGRGRGQNGGQGETDRALYATIPESKSECNTGLVARLQVNDTFGDAEKPAHEWRIRTYVRGG